MPDTTNNGQHEYEENLSGITKNTKLVRTVGGNRTVHMINCRYIKDWNINGCVAVDRFNPKLMHTCPLCEGMVYTSFGAEDFNEKWLEYQRIWERFGISNTALIEFFGKARAKTFISESPEAKSINISSKKERWRIDILPDGTIKLFHNNYKKSDVNGSGRIDKPGFHEHALMTKTSLYESMRQIINYNYEKAETVHKKKRKKTVTFQMISEEDEWEKLFS